MANGRKMVSRNFHVAYIPPFHAPFIAPFEKSGEMTKIIQINNLIFMIFFFIFLICLSAKKNGRSLRVRSLAPPPFSFLSPPLAGPLLCSGRHHLRPLPPVALALPPLAEPGGAAAALAKLGLLLCFMPPQRAGAPRRW